jgi:hypothetical protein
MRRKLIFPVAAVAAAVLALFLPGAVAGASFPDDTAHGPACANIVDGGIVSYDPATQTMVFEINTAAPSCPGIAYTLTITDPNTGAPITTVSANGNKGIDTGVIPAVPGLFVTVANIPASVTTDGVCISATSNGDRVFDKAPDSGCSVFVYLGPPPFTGFH